MNDPCLMPVAGDHLCHLPGDHDGACQRAPLVAYDGTPVIGWSPEPPAPRCACSHARISHTRREGQCWSAACGCRSYRPKEQDQ